MDVYSSNVRFVPKADSRTAANILVIRSPRGGGRIARPTVVASEVVLIKTDDFHPVRALSCRILADQLHGAACLVDRVGRNRVRLFPRDNEKSSLGINRKRLF
jgi:hypothetical protein